jgi:hypothetical protein
MKIKKNSVIIAACIATVAVLAGAAFLATRLINRNATGSPLASAGEMEPGPAGKRVAAGPPVLPSDLIPQRDTDVTGEITHIQDNSIFVSAVVLDGVMDPNNQNLPDVEVVVTKDTKIYRPAGTETTTDSSGKAVEQKKYEVVTINDLTSNDILNVWGEKRGDRYYAAVLTFIH